MPRKNYPLVGFQNQKERVEALRRKRAAQKASRLRVGDITENFIAAVKSKPVLWNPAFANEKEEVQALRYLGDTLKKYTPDLDVNTIKNKVQLMKKLYKNYCIYQKITGHRSLHVAEAYFTQLEFMNDVIDTSHLQLEFGYNHQKTLEDMHTLFDDAQSNKYSKGDPRGILLNIFSECDGALTKAITDVTNASNSILSNNNVRLPPEYIATPSVVVLRPNPSDTDSKPPNKSKKTVASDVIDLDSDESITEVCESDINTISVNAALNSVKNANKQDASLKNNPNKEKLLNLVSEMISDELTDYGPYGLFVVRKLREMPNEMAIYCRKIIMEALYEAEEGRLNTLSTITGLK